ncbi:MAG TPA: AbrB/MazE/SpoVT family DNA-binding domain-containing protein [Allosphingosinicella sp.]|jgi:antitoxin VapB|uniref:AbrB family transcriptional regulator n=1 Tax=Allosphingosinicella sp. TaxID=2823234 RepID=UPI002F27B21D
MARKFKTKTFKSGNSVAVRLPKALGFVEGDELAIVPHADGSLSLWKESRRLDILMSLYGAFSPGFMADGRGDVEQEDYDWSRAPERDRAA